MWHELVGTPGNLGGTSGTATVPPGAIVTCVVAHASSGGASVAIFGGTAIPVVNGAPPLVVPMMHDLYVANASNSGTIVFTGTDSYAVFYVTAGTP